MQNSTRGWMNKNNVLSTMKEKLNSSFSPNNMLFGNNNRPFHYYSGLKGKSFMSINELSKEDICGLLDTARALKASYKKVGNKEIGDLLKGKSVAMIFQKRSTRTRVSTETGVAMLGGHALFLGPSDIQLGVNESMRDTANVLSRFNSIILARVFGHEDVMELNEHGSVPVINALSDLHHPLQALADMQTLQEHFGADNLQGKKIAWVGDGNNVFHDLGLAASALGMHVAISNPEGYDANETVMKIIADNTKANGVTLTTTRSPIEAVTDADIVVTDTWVSMGQEDEYAARIKQFEGYQVNENLMSYAKENAVFLHCLPRHQEEVNDEVFYSKKSLVFDEAENRMWTVMSVILSQLDPTPESN